MQAKSMPELIMKRSMQKALERMVNKNDKPKLKQLRIGER